MPSHGAISVAAACHGRLTPVPVDTCARRDVGSELGNHGEYGVEAQLLKQNELVIGRRFDTRELAVLG